MPALCVTGISATVVSVRSRVVAFAMRVLSLQQFLFFEIRVVLERTGASPLALGGSRAGRELELVQLRARLSRASLPAPRRAYPVPGEVLAPQRLGSAESSLTYVVSWLYRSDTPSASSQSRTVFSV